MAAESELLPYRSFETTLEELPEYLAANGVAVLHGILSADDIAEMREAMWSLLSRLTKHLATPVVKDDCATWATVAQLDLIKGMLIKCQGVAHSPLAWMARQHPKVAEAFGAVWKCGAEDLVTSFDALSIHLPPELAGEACLRRAGYYNKRDWFHVDQSYARPEFECVQGFINLFDVHEGDATLAVLTGSHQHFKEFSVRIGDRADINNEFYLLSQADMDYFLAAGCKRTNVLCPAGSLVLWDSRTVHCGCLPQRGRVTPVPRCVVYVCQWPRSQLSEEQLAQKRKHLATRTMTSHWPDGRDDMPDLVDVWGAPALTPLGLRLTGGAGVE